MTLLDPHTLAKRYEAACVRARGDFADERIEIAGGVAPRSVRGSWMNRAEGLGMAGEVTGEDVKRLIAWYAEGGLPTRIKVCPYAHESLLMRLNEHGFQITSFEQVLALPLKPEAVSVGSDIDPAVELRTLERSDETAMRQLAMTLALAFSTPQAPPVEKDLEHMVRCMRRERATTLALYAGSDCIGGGGVEVDGDLAVFYGAGVSEPWRRKGLQQALIAARIGAAAQAGGTIAIISSTPGEATERNALRRGFVPVYTKVMMERALTA